LAKTVSCAFAHFLEHFLATSYSDEQGWYRTNEWLGQWAATVTPSATAMQQDIGANSVPMQMTHLRPGRLPWNRSDTSTSIQTLLITSYAQA